MNNVGQITFFDEIEDTIGSRNSRKFLKQLFMDFSKKSRKYFDITGDLPYIYREQQLHSVLVPVIDNIADALQVECPTNRKDRKSGLSSYGWIDYWVKYGNTIFLIELKHSYKGLASKEFKKKSIEEWETANEQLKCIPKKDFDAFQVNNETIVKVALQFNTTYTTSKDMSFSKEECEKIGMEIYHSLSLKPDFIAHWNIHSDMQNEYEYTDRSEVYPYVHMFAKIYT